MASPTSVMGRVYYGYSAKDNTTGPDDMRWAHDTWNFLHGMSFYIDQFENEDKEAQQAFQSMVTGLQYYLPCTWCRKHLAKHLAETPMPTPGTYAPDAFLNARWCVDLHNAVNKRQHKTAIPFEQVKAHYVDGAPEPSCPPQFDQHSSDTSSGRDSEQIIPQNLVKPITISVAVIVVFFILLVLTLRLIALRNR